MDVIYGLIPSMIIIGIILVIILFWAIKSGQFDDFEGEAHRILMDEDLTPAKTSEKKKNIWASLHHADVHINVFIATIYSLKNSGPILRKES